MKSYFFCLLFSVTGFLSYSQNYQTVFPDKQALFTNKKWKYFESLYNFGGTNSYLGLEIDSSKVQGQDLFCYHQIILPCISTPNWTGPVTIVKANGDNIFFTEDLDTIRIKTSASVNDTWHLYDFVNGDYFEAKIISKQEVSTLGNTDSIKTLEIFLKDNLGNLKTHDFNGKQIVLSKNYGLVKAYDFSKFPDDTSTFILKGLSNPSLGIQNITARQVYDFNIGDEFQYEVNRGGSPGRHGTFREIVLAKTISTNQDTLTYSVEQVRIQYAGSPDTPERDTVIQKIIVSERADINTIPMKAYKYTLVEDHPGTNWDTLKGFTSNTLGYRSMLNYYQGSFPNPSNRLVKSRLSDYLFHKPENEDCSFPYLLSDESTRIEYHIEGLGSYQYGYYPQDIHWNFDKRLLYYKKGFEAWGTPVDFDALLSVNQKNDFRITSKVLPNPFTDYTVLKIKNDYKQTYQIILADVFGKIVKEYSFNEDQLIIENDGSMKGMYFYKLYNKQQDEVDSGKIVVY